MIILQGIVPPLEKKRLRIVTTNAEFRRGRTNSSIDL